MDDTDVALDRLQAGLLHQSYLQSDTTSYYKVHFYYSLKICILQKPSGFFNVATETLG